jgi:CheY-like chemotaxis protein
LKIAIVDDEKGILLSLSLFLEIEGHVPITFNSPLRALKIIPKEDVDLIILDMRMPEMNGDDVALALKGNSLTKNIPIILISAHNNLVEIAEKVGAQGVLEKPFQFNKLMELISKYERVKLEERCS